MNYLDDNNEKIDKKSKIKMYIGEKLLDEMKAFIEKMSTVSEDITRKLN